MLIAARRRMAGISVPGLSYDLSMAGDDSTSKQWQLNHDSAQLMSNHRNKGLQYQLGLKADAGVAIMVIAGVIAFPDPQAGEAFAAARNANPILSGRVTDVIDGDTIRVQLASGPIRVRLHAVDAPERDQPYGREALATLYARVANRDVELEVVDQDRYDRQVAVVVVAGVNVNAELVQQGHAWAYREYLTDLEYCRWEGAARQQQKGVWALPVAEQVAPWEWRDLGRGERFVATDYTRKSVGDCIRAAGTRTLPVPPAGEGCNIKGNISANGRIFHVPGTRDYERTRIDESQGERWFCTAEEARAQGWRPPGR